MNLWLDGAHDPAENMRRDRLLLAAAEAGAEPVLRLFTFEPHGITLGASEAPERTLDLDRCAVDRVPWAVRPTGGRAIFHAQEWTYALAAPIADPRWGGSQSAVYMEMSRVIVAALRRLGVPAAIARQDRAAGARIGGACFASTARHEVEIDGRKLVGSAQRRTQTAFLQQGSVLVGDGHLRLADYLRISQAERKGVRERLVERSTDAGSWLGPDATLAHWADALMAELPEAPTRLEGAQGLFLLTLEKPSSYTASLAQRDP
jgi:lipoate-protein ligase A